MPKYLHFAKSNDAENILAGGVVDNSLSDPSQGFGNNKQLAIYGKIRGREGRVKAFFYDTSLSDGLLPIAMPWSRSDCIKTVVGQKALGLIPYPIQVFDVEKFRAIIFDIKERTQYMVDRYATNDRGDTKYIETISLKPIGLTHVQEIETREACMKFLGMKEPFEIPSFWKNIQYRRYTPDGSTFIA